MDIFFLTNNVHLSHNLHSLYFSAEIKKMWFSYRIEYNYRFYTHVTLKSK